MSKDEAVAFLLSEGYNAYLDNSVVQIDVETSQEVAPLFEKVLKRLREEGYEASFGVIAKGKRDLDKENNSQKGDL